MSRSFKLVFLEENEEYISDIGCLINVLPPSSPLPSTTSFSIVQLVKATQYRGRLRIGSHAMYLDLESLPEIIKVPFKLVTDINQPTNECIRLHVSGLSAIPTVCVGGKTRLFKPISSVSSNFEISISLHASHLPDIVSVLGALFRARNDSEDRGHYVSGLLANSVVPFDLTSLASHREVLLLPAPMRVVRIKKMLEINGLIQVSRNFIYFQAIPNLGSQKLKRFPFPCSTNLLKYKLKNTGVEFDFTGKKLFVLFQTIADRDRCLRVVTSADKTELPPLEVVTKLWIANRIGNFEYLMYLNWTSGRSLNDIGQYPVLPWTLKNMTSATIDLNDPANYRDFSLPVAASNPVKLAQCRERAQHMGTSERFLFGSFYSNPALVLYFLLRRFPECHLRLHGGHFDHGARLFTSLQTSWDAGTMELIPEFFSDSHMAKGWLENPAAMRLVPELQLPPWASSSAEFVTTMRASLESAHTSAHLHEWIDLVFGVKSRGSQICWSSNNLFHPICYLTDVDGDAKSYCQETETSIDVAVLQSQEFGHVPKQLFLTESHPKRDMNGSTHVPECTDWKAVIIAQAAKQVPQSEPVALQQNQNIGIKHKEGKILSKSQMKVTSTVFKDLKDVIVDCVVSGNQWAVVTAQGYFVSSLTGTRWRLSARGGLNCVVQLGGSFVCGDAHGFVHYVSPTEGLLKSRRMHLASVTCIATRGNEIFSGSRDQTVCVWDASDWEANCLLDSHTAAVTAICIGVAGHFLSGDAKGGLVFWKARAIAWTANSGTPVCSIDICPDGSAAVAVGTALTVWDTLTGSMLWQHRGSVHSALAVGPRTFLLSLTGKTLSVQTFGLSQTEFKAICDEHVLDSQTAVPSLKRQGKPGNYALLTSTHLVSIVDAT